MHRKPGVGNVRAAQSPALPAEARVREHLAAPARRWSLPRRSQNRTSRLSAAFTQLHAVGGDAAVLAQWPGGPR